MRAPAAHVRAGAPTFVSLSGGLLPEAMPVLGHVDEGFDHLRLNVIAAKLVELAQSEVVAVQVEVRDGVRGPTVARFC